MNSKPKTKSKPDLDRLKHMFEELQDIKRGLLGLDKMGIKNINRIEFDALTRRLAALEQEFKNNYYRVSERNQCQSAV